MSFFVDPNSDEFKQPAPVVNAAPQQEDYGDDSGGWDDGPDTELAGNQQEGDAHTGNETAAELAAIKAEAETIRREAQQWRARYDGLQKPIQRQAEELKKLREQVALRESQLAQTHIEQLPEEYRPLANKVWEAEQRAAALQRQLEEQATVTQTSQQREEELGRLAAAQQVSQALPHINPALIQEAAMMAQTPAQFGRFVQQLAAANPATNANQAQRQSRQNAGANRFEGGQSPSSRPAKVREATTMAEARELLMQKLSRA